NTGKQPITIASKLCMRRDIKEDLLTGHKAGTIKIPFLILDPGLEMTSSWS
ncbi:hypothetical protein ACJX0J_016624, partial [Zea mays]